MPAAGADEPAPGPVVVKAWAPWCSSCRALMPTVDDVAGHHRSVTVVDVRVDTDEAAVARHAIRAVPTLIAVADGVEVARLVGLQPASAVHTLFEAALGGEPPAPPRATPALTAARAGAGALLAIAGAVLASAVLVIVGAVLVGWAAFAGLRRGGDR